VRLRARTCTDKAPPLKSRHPAVLDAVIALITTTLCSLLVYRDLGKPMLTGIDDENITQAYGRNLANGFGPCTRRTSSTLRAPRPLFG
jgi:hypothetical protein